MKTEGTKIYEDKTSKEKGKRAQARDNIEFNERGHLSLITIFSEYT